MFFHYQVGSLVDYRRHCRLILETETEPGRKVVSIISVWRGPPALRLVLDPLAVLLLHN